MVHPGIVPGDHVVFVSSDHDVAKQAVREILVSFGWPTDRIIDLGALSTARGTEALLLLWLPARRSLGGAQFNWAIHKAAD
jgi:predicted dinucleotide-binding enzyme